MGELMMMNLQVWNVMIITKNYDMQSTYFLLKSLDDLFNSMLEYHEVISLKELYIELKDTFDWDLPMISNQTASIFKHQGWKKDEHICFCTNSYEDFNESSHILTNYHFIH